MLPKHTYFYFLFVFIQYNNLLINSCSFFKFINSLQKAQQDGFNVYVINAYLIAHRIKKVTFSKIFVTFIIYFFVLKIKNWRVGINTPSTRVPFQEDVCPMTSEYESGQQIEVTAIFK